ncbi:membrane protein insertase YidC [Piscinibacter sp. Jin2]|uniref:Membrane protein insertase YidC n=1 Tax=Aquariibacter lacus TaxID=2801332 RepID=A0A9X0XBS4_9BURK|nr:membrane protein insertase YidC [Piscinibacter lacus]MBL0718584.1 membrane protein insertase YidC [Piscinibacter lacus]
MTDMRRTILWVVFLMSLVLLWDAWNRHTGQPTLFGMPTPTQQAAASAAPPTGSSAAAAALPTPSALGVEAGATPPAASTAASTTPTVTVTTDALKVTVDHRGADIVRVELLGYHDAQKPGQNAVLLDRSAERVYLAQTGLVGEPDLPTHLSTFQLEPGPTTLAPGADALELVFTAQGSQGLKLRKILRFSRGSFVIAVRHELQNEGSEALRPQLYQQLVRDGNPPPGESSFYQTFTGPALYTELDKFRKIDFEDIEKGQAEHPKTSSDGWIAMVQHYFASAWLHADSKPREFYTKKVDTNLYALGQIFPLGELAPGASLRFDSQLFVGPQEENKLAALAPGLELVKDYGWVTILAKPLFWLLDKLHGLIGNWGWAIVALVVLLKAAFYWLNASAYRSMAKMKAVSPRVMAMRERLKDKPQEMQQEMMKLYREEKVNPLGGCLPILVQIPVFIALYWVLLSSVEMRGAPWIGWISDLSIKDPYYILPVVMTASTLLQTWLNPTPPDPMQAKMMWIMPMIFSVMFFFFPAGLVLYWITNNLLSIAQQWVINRKLGVN